MDRIIDINSQNNINKLYRNNYKNHYAHHNPLNNNN